MRWSEEGGHLATTVSAGMGCARLAAQRVTVDGEHSPDLLRLSNGNILLTYGECRKPFGVQALLSRDAGKSWDLKRRIMIALDGDHGDLGYPISIQRRDGRIVTAYCIVHGPYNLFVVKGVAPKNAYTKTVIWELPKN